MAVTVLKPEGTDNARATENETRALSETVVTGEASPRRGRLPRWHNAGCLAVDAAVKVEVRFVRIPNTVSEGTRRLVLLEEPATEHYSVCHILWRHLLASPPLVWVKP